MIDKKLISNFKQRYEGAIDNLVIEGAIAKSGVNVASINNEAKKRHNFMFSDKTKKGDVTFQGASGRCWMFAALNTARTYTMEKYDMKNFEFSQNYTLFWDKLERSNYFLDCIIATVELPVGSREVKHLLDAPLNDGGQWDMFSSILRKYGAVPKDHMPETYNSTNTSEMRKVLTSMLRFFASELRDEYAKTKDTEKLENMKEDYLYRVYNVLVKSLGRVPEVVNFEYYDKDDKYHRLPAMTPVEFFENVVGWNLDDKISLINAPTEDKPYGRVFNVKYLGSISEAKKVKHLNAPIEVLKEAAIKSIQNNEPVWFGCDVGQISDRQAGIMDIDLYAFEKTLGYAPSWTKAKRLDYGESLLTHAMVFTGVNLDENGKPTIWEVENSWGEKVGKKGVFSMSDEWFDVFLYQIMIDKKYLSDEWVQAYSGETIELAPWDPMGALAL